VRQAVLTVITDADTEFLLSSPYDQKSKKYARAKASGRLLDGAPAQLHSCNMYHYQDADNAIDDEDARLHRLFLDAGTQLVARAKRHGPVVNGTDMLFSVYFHGAGAVFDQDNCAALMGLFEHVLD